MVFMPPCLYLLVVTHFYDKDETIDIRLRHTRGMFFLVLVFKVESILLNE